MSKIPKIKGERWKSVLDDVFVSSYGRLRRGSGQEARLLKPHLNSRGYMCVTLRGQEGQVHTTLGSLVMRSFRKVPDYPGGKTAPVTYRDGDRSNCKLSNLDWR